MADTTVITVTVGGNDLDFTGVMTEAAKPSWLADSGPLLDETERRVGDDLSGWLAPLYATLRDRAPLARLLVVGYPRLFSSADDCSLVTFFSPEEIARLNGIADRIAQVKAKLCADADVEYLDVRDEFAGHGVCAADEWIRGASWPLEQSFHPDADGHAAYARAVLTALGRPEPVPADRPPPPVTLGHTPARPHPVFTPPDLTSPESLAGAAAWGLDPNRVAELGHRVRPSDPAATPDPDAARRLKELHEEVRERRGWA